MNEVHQKERQQNRSPVQFYFFVLDEQARDLPGFVDLMLPYGARVSHGVRKL
jgi:hypothetical protein